MDARHAALAFSALSQETRIGLLDRLRRAGSAGLAAGELGAALEVRPSTLSFHLAALEQAQLIRGTRRGRQLIYTAHAPGLRGLVRSLAELCGDDDAWGERIRALLDEPAAPALAPSFNVLFLCRHNSARSIMAEAILAGIGGGRFRGYSAGPDPAPAPLPQVIDLLRAHGHDVATLRSKSWAEFARETSARMDFVITLCDMPDDTPGPDLGSPVAGLWLLPDPTRFAGSQRERSALLAELYAGLRRRLERFCRLPLAAMDRATAKLRLDQLGGLATTG
ncbi:metalloregulator ArsR/SmtB family transcription factor [Stella sp.]|uniref:metalloregulator ArsR/SmtB family transcription factor n=1 Tax=Stella sp. TaxID=2912054 RepID=UPI0035B3FBD5